MKKIRILGLLVLVLMMTTAHIVSAQIKKTEDPGFKLSINGPDGKGGKTTYEFSGGLEQIKITPSGIIKQTLTFQLPSDHPFMFFAWAKVSLTLYVDVDGDGIDDVKIKDKRSVLTPNGKLKIDVHYNPKKVYEEVELED